MVSTSQLQNYKCQCQIPWKMSVRVALSLELEAAPFFFTMKVLHAAPIRALQ